MPEIKNYDIYNSEMEKGMKDKLFFIKFLNPDLSYTFIDFGCANGKLLEQLSKIRENSDDLYIGYDKSPDMISFAKSQWNGIGHILFTTHWDDCLGLKNPILILSSVIHEVISYGTKPEIDNFWDVVFKSNFDYIFIRDMCCSKTMNREVPKSYGENWFWDKLYADNEHNEFFVQQVKQFEDKWGSVFTVKNFLHFLLKYRYVVNWDRELQENYFALSQKELLSRIASSDYDVLNFSRFQLPIIKKYTHSTTNTIMDSTHVKVALTKRNSFGDID